jgi:ABC-type antimicrobial peptide transport system permease subunit
MVSGHFFKVLGAPIVDGRGFTADDRQTSPFVCVINQTLAKHLFDGRPALNEAILIGRDANIPLRIVGVVRDMKTNGASNATPDEIYMTIEQRSSPALLVLARTTGDPVHLQAAIRDAVAAVDRNQAISFFATMESTAAQSVGAQRLLATLTLVFAGLALALALIGLYSVLAYGVSQRTPELGIRMALGASRRDVVGLVMRGGLTLVGVGLIAGLAGAAAISRLIRQLLFGVGPLSAGIYIGVAAVFLVIGALACLAPSLRASRIDPLNAVRGTAGGA